MGVVMMVGIVVSNSILIVEFTNRLREEGRPLREAVALACRVRLRPVLMTSLATLIGLIPMAAETRHRQRSLRAAGARHHRRPGGFGGADRVHRAGGVPDSLSPAGRPPRPGDRLKNPFHEFKTLQFAAGRRPGRHIEPNRACGERAGGFPYAARGRKFGAQPTIPESLQAELIALAAQAGRARDAFRLFSRTSPRMPPRSALPARTPASPRVP